MSNLDKLRISIDNLDKKILELVSKRADCAKKIGTLKKDGVIYKPEREAQIYRKLIEENKGPLSSESIRSIFSSIISSCRALEKKLAVSFLGPQGTFSEEAVIKRFGNNIHFVPAASIDEVFSNVQSNESQYGVVPVENSTEGAVSRTLDLLLSSDLKICGEVILPIHHNLMASVSNLKSIKKVYSHGQSLAQCHNWLMNHLPNVEIQAVLSNSEGVRLAKKEKGSAAIASERAANLYKLKVIRENIEDEKTNTTRFLILSSQDTKKSGDDKTSIVVATKNKPGAIADLVQPFAKNKVSMTKLESRPAKIGMWEYVFFIDLDGHHDDPKVKKSLAEVESKASFLKHLGSYPKY
jgi:chorismate mutase/prephenate dehydratase